jgi:antitoxin component YwqK of YwqJK toxin-antitoxin module
MITPGMNMPNQTLIRFSALLFVLSLSFQVFADGLGELNRVDANGLRQGYWIIKGYMLKNAGYSANATVEEGHYLNGNKEGLWKRFYPDGKLRNEITFRNGSPYGPYTVYYPNGLVEERGSWHRNKNVGEFARFYDDGKPQQAFFFADNGKRNGVQKYYHDNGQLALEVEIINGKEEGIMRRYYPDGRLKETKEMNDGILESGSVRKYGPGTAKPKATEKTENAMPVDQAPSLTPTEAEPNEAFRFEPNGHNILYNKARQITQAGEFKNGRLYNGKWYRYNADGLLIKIEIYQNGRYLGSGVITENNK